MVNRYWSKSTVGFLILAPEPSKSIHASMGFVNRYVLEGGHLRHFHDSALWFPEKNSSIRW